MRTENLKIIKVASDDDGHKIEQRSTRKENIFIN